MSKDRTSLARVVTSDRARCFRYTFAENWGMAGQEMNVYCYLLGILFAVLYPN